MHNDIEARRGLTTGIALYLMWGFFPLYFRLLERSGAFEIIAHRVVWSFAFCAILLTIGKGWHRLAALAHDRRSLWGLVLAGHLVLINWTLYVWSVNAGHTLDAAMGYFINPLVSALLGVLVLRERLSPAQWMAFGIGIVAVVVLMVGHSSTPLISLGLAMSFGLYGLVKKVLGVAVKPAVGLIVETLATTPLALVYIGWGVAQGKSTFTGSYSLLLVSAGILTAVPLLMFAFAASRISLTTLGILQYISPLLQFLVGLFLFGEQMPWQRWVGFSLVWVAVVMFSAEGLIRLVRRTR
ncbi:MAG: EamA family transporter RarD [Cutibacterium avidum]|uniref:EamA family transporter RarD n=2 Tax=Cutibacterium avidum TaxID=33010 RepID=UPI00080F878F|nr:EamA family transporter RarD [Cutibacterium avidum]MBS5746128.1 EamA family transporter RarD [Propionibacterium sp.]MDK7360041.1 EamA family transporter RarD [Cutibacterium avidum]MDK7373745.1 EamA family transporter RarD [Cutibacterium avidum]MDU3727168.1 EamA family transporter RarD [Cutibacterium avidum]MDU4207902.1 EamA family transporter RarD [Cutibacterium avidum]